MKYTLNLVAIPLIFLAAVVLAGAFGGSEFERGAAALLTLLLGDHLKVTVEGRSDAFEAAVWSIMAASLTVTGLALIMVIKGIGG